jgi:acetylserotonin O-methyltransferase
VTQNTLTARPADQRQLATPAGTSAATPDSPKPPTPTVILDLITGFRRSKTMFAAVSLKIFDTLASGGKSCKDIAEALELNADALERLLDACVGLKLLRYRDGIYENTSVSKAYLVSESPLKLTGYIHSSNYFFWQLWEHLESAIREGGHRYQQAFDFDGPFFEYLFKTERDKEEFLSGMHGFGQITSPNLVRAFDLSEYKILVDLGGGTGHFAIAACKEYPELKATVFEVSEAAELAVKTISESPVRDRNNLLVRDRIDVVTGDFFEDDLPEADLYCLARILHDWPEDKILALLKKIHDRIKPEGALLIAEKLLNEDRSGPSWAQMQHLNMLVIAEGKERTLTQYRELLGQVGFTEVRAAVTDSPLDCILAEKACGKKTTPVIRPIEVPEIFEAQPWSKRPAFPIEAEMYAAFFEHADVGFVIADVSGRFLLVNEAFAKILGRTVSETLQMNYRHLTPEDYAEEDAEQIKILMDKKSYGPFQKQYIRKEKDKKTSLVSARVMLKIIKLGGKEHIWASVEGVPDQLEIGSKGGKVVEYR